MSSLRTHFFRASNNRFAASWCIWKDNLACVKLIEDSEQLGPGWWRTSEKCLLAINRKRKNEDNKKRESSRKSLSRHYPHPEPPRQQFIHYTIPGRREQNSTRNSMKRGQPAKGNIIIHKFVWLQPIKTHFSTLKSSALTPRTDACRSHLSDSPILNTTKRNQIEKEDFLFWFLSIQAITTGFLFEINASEEGFKTLIKSITEGGHDVGSEAHHGNGLMTRHFNGLEWLAGSCESMRRSRQGAL